MQKKMRHLSVCIFPSILHSYFVVILQHSEKLQIKIVQNIHTCTDRQGHIIDLVRMQAISYCKNFHTLIILR